MSFTVTLTLDDETADYLKRIADDQGRTPAEVAAWIVKEDLRREQAIDADLVARADDVVIGAPGQPGRFQTSADDTARRERAGG